ncbi:MAG TPA: RGCVC family protein [Actinomycetospora sp.]|uniref:RGCVC family protein n=1 Tax=Actinomycetospora sp. TaxID=1872135 RepID=UPI002F408FD0
MDEPKRGRHEQRTGTTCPACPHQWAEHDALGRRFCEATRNGGWSRGCICR